MIQGIELQVYSEIARWGFNPIKNSGLVNGRYNTCNDAYFIPMNACGRYAGIARLFNSTEYPLC